MIWFKWNTNPGSKSNAIISMNLKKYKSRQTKVVHLRITSNSLNTQAFQPSIRCHSYLWPDYSVCVYAIIIDVIFIFPCSTTIHSFHISAFCLPILVLYTSLDSVTSVTISDSPIHEGVDVVYLTVDLLADYVSYCEVF